MLMRYSQKILRTRTLIYFKLEEKEDKFSKQGVFLKFAGESPISTDLSPAWYADLMLSIVSSMSKVFL